MVPTAFALSVFNTIPPHTPSSNLCQNGRGIDVNDLTEEVYILMKQRGEISLTSTVAGRLYVIRVVAANSKPDEEHVRKTFATILSATEEVLRQSFIRDVSSLMRQLMQRLELFNRGLCEVA